MKLWNICSISAVMAPGSRLKHNRTPNRLLFKSGPVSSTSFSDTPWWRELELNTTLICLGLHGWYTPNVGKYQHSSLSCRGRASSAWWWLKIFCINATMLLHLRPFIKRMTKRDETAQGLFCVVRQACPRKTKGKLCHPVVCVIHEQSVLNWWGHFVIICCSFGDALWAFTAVTSITWEVCVMNWLKVKRGLWNAVCIQLGTISVHSLLAVPKQGLLAVPKQTSPTTTQPRSSLWA